MEKAVINYDIPIQGEKHCEEYNKTFETHENFTPMKSTEEHVATLYEKLIDTIQKVGDEGGWYVGDGIKIKIEIEYEPEDK